MTIEVRAVDPAEAEAFTRCTWTAFGAVPNEERLGRDQERFDPAFALAAVDGGRIVATASAKALELTLPAGVGSARPTVAVAGVTAVGVFPTHRRQGLLTRMMHHQLADLRDRGYPLAMLFASEAIIYGRFGYGAAQYRQGFVVDPFRSAYRRDAAAAAAEGRVRMVDPDEAAKLLPPVHERARRQRPGELNRNARWWRWHLKDPESHRDQGNARLYAMHESAQGVADGWVSYRFHEIWDVGDLPRGRVEVDDLVATTPAVRAALWRLVLDLDLVEVVRARERPVDETLKWLLADLRRARTAELVDHLWLRILDIPAALEARGYGAAERLVLEVTSPIPPPAGRFVLESGPESGSCRAPRDGENGQLVLGLADLGALYLGGVSPRRAGRRGPGQRASARCVGGRRPRVCGTRRPVLQPAFLSPPRSPVACPAMAKPPVLTPRAVDFPRWYQDVIARAEMADNGPVRGTMVIRPYGYAIWERMQAEVDARIKEAGAENAYFPLFIPESYLRKEAEHVEGFSPELAVVTIGGGKVLEEPIVVRPTSETIINSYFAKWIQSYRDLPLLINQWANVVRWELRPRLFLRTTEFLWQEGHTAHASQADAYAYARRILTDVYRSVMVDVLAVPVELGVKTARERFAGAIASWTCEGIMGDGKAVQMGTSHELGQNFSKVFGTTYSSETGAQEFVWQTSWGVSTRLVGALIMAHGDDNGLRLPPLLAPVQVVVMLVRDEAGTRPVAETLVAELKAAGVRAVLDARVDQSFGRRAVEWELKGVPVRLEVGPRDLAVGQVTLVRRHDASKAPVDVAAAPAAVAATLEQIQASLLQEALNFRESHTVAREHGR